MAGATSSEIRSPLPPFLCVCFVFLSFSLKASNQSFCSGGGDIQNFSAIYPFFYLSSMSGTTAWPHRQQRVCLFWSATHSSGVTVLLLFLIVSVVLYRFLRQPKAWLGKGPKGKGGGSLGNHHFYGAAMGNGKYILSFRILFCLLFLFFLIILVVFHFQGREWQEIRERTFR